MKRRAYQEKGLELAILNRSCIWFWSRQDGKTTCQSELSLFEMMKFKGRTVVFATATLLLGREIILKDSDTLQSALLDMRREAATQKMDLQIQDHEKPGKNLTGKITADDFTELFEAKRLEFWLYHDRNTFSRTIVIAPSVATARGWTGTVMLDEIGHIPDLRELMTAIKPIMQTNPAFRLIMSGTPPEDDTHFSFELFQPPIGMEFAPNPEGCVFENESGIPVHRVDLYDAMLAGKKIYHPVNGTEISAMEDRRLDADRDGWDRNHALTLRPGGTAACSLLLLDNAQRRGVGQCLFIQIESDLDLQTAVAFLRSHLGGGRVGIGVDIATTTKGTSNPTSVTVTEKDGVDKIQRLVAVWKTWDPDIADERIGAIVDCVNQRPVGGRARKLATDGTNERYYAISLQRYLAGRVPVDIVVMSVSVELPGNDKPVNFKTHLSTRYIGELEDNHWTCPPERYFKEDHRLVKKDRGLFVCEPDSQGRHGDTFSSGMLADWAVESTGGAITAETVRKIRIGGRRVGSAPVFIPNRLV
jgi:hypothetical protein